MNDLLLRIAAGASRRSIVGLAPMAGYSDAPFRLLCAASGADFAVTEMISADGLVRNGAKTRFLLERLDGEASLGVQLFGANPETMARAAEIAAASAPTWIDLNFGCPVRKVVRKNGGVAVMRDLSLMRRIAEAVVHSVDIPVTAKIRSGWSEREENYLDAARILEDSGISALTLHPRYRSQGFSGRADWSQIARLVRHVSIPVVANGDVRSAEDVEEVVRATGCRAVMIGRGALGRPWLFREVKCRMAGRRCEPITLAERIDAAERLARVQAAWRGERSGMLEMRKHYRWFFKGVPSMREHRISLSRSGTLAETLGILESMRKESCGSWKRPA